MSRAVPSTTLFLALWALLVATAFATRPLLPVDETRYLAVAWEMWLRGDFLVPYLNGEPYSHKPPLLFWLFHAGWGVFGVNEWWPRLVAPLLALANAGLTLRLARALWPGRSGIGRDAAWILSGALLWTGFCTLVQFDLLVVFCTLLGMLGILRARGAASGWWLTGAAIGLGVLAKGPVILLHVLPAALLAPWWGGAPPGARRRWYGGVLFSILLGAALALAWALPAAGAGGAAYREAIFWGQTAERMVDSFAHRQPWWWYLPLLPLILLPWSLWPALWRAALAQARVLPAGPAVRFLLSWLVPVLIAFSLISGKQVKYLLPLFPAFALLAARALNDGAAERVRVWLPGALLAAGGAVLLYLPGLGRPGVAGWLGDIQPQWGAALLAPGLVMILARGVGRDRALPLFAASSVLLVVVFHFSVVRAGAPAYDLRPIGGVLAGHQRAGRPLLNVGKYHGQFHFPGRLRRPLEVAPQRGALDWARAHPRGLLLVYYDDWPGAIRGADFAQPWRGGGLALWPAAAILERPERLLPSGAGAGVSSPDGA